jgi:uncharacterized membrane protein (DUF2068 family)
VEGRPDRDGPPLQAAVRRLQPGQDGPLRPQVRCLPGDPVPRAPRAVAAAEPSRRHVLARLWIELGRKSESQDTFIRLIIVERLIKATILIGLALALIVLGRTGILYRWAVDANRELLLAADANVIFMLIDRVLVYVGFFQHQTILGLVLIAYALVEGAEGVGLALRRRWAEYLIVFATGLLIPYEVWEVVHKVTVFRVGGLILNVAIVAYLAYKKRLFVDL